MAEQHLLKLQTMILFSSAQIYLHHGPKRCATLFWTIIPIFHGGSLYFCTNWNRKQERTLYK